MNGQKVSSVNEVVATRWTSVLPADRLRPARVSNLSMKMRELRIRLTGEGKEFARGVRSPLEAIASKWRAQGDDFRTFLGQFVVATGQFDFPVGF